LTDRVNKYLGSSKRGKEARLKEKEWGEKRGLRVGERKRKKNGLTHVSCHLQIPRCYRRGKMAPVGVNWTQHRFIAQSMLKTQGKIQGGSLCPGLYSTLPVFPKKEKI